MAVDKLVDSTQLNTDLASVANAIRAKSGGSGQLTFPSGFVSEIGNIPSGGDDAIISSTTKRIWMLGAIELKTSAFVGYQMEVFYAPDVTKTGQYSFNGVNNLKALILPNLTNAGDFTLWVTTNKAVTCAIDLSKKITFNNVKFRDDSPCDVILRSAEMCPNTAMTATTWGVGAKTKFYVPSSLLSSYLADTNWNTFGSSRILPIDGSAYENTDWWKAI